jgi:hypothetical protein
MQLAVVEPAENLATTSLKLRHKTNATSPSAISTGQRLAIHKQKAAIDDALVM